MKYQENKIYMTKDPSIFKNLAGNRSTTHWKIIYNSIKKHGYYLNPIMVNENMEIIDGQGRTIALTELGYPHYYYIVSGATINECRILNARQKNWSLMDYIESYAQAGGAIDYVWLKQAIAMYKNLPMEVVIFALGGLQGASYGEYVRNGNFKIRDYNEGIEILDFLTQIQPYFEGQLITRTFKVITGLLFSNLIEKDRLLDSLKKYPYQIKTFTRVQDDLDILQDIYNYRRVNKVYFKDKYMDISNHKGLSRRK